MNLFVAWLQVWLCVMWTLVVIVLVFSDPVSLRTYLRDCWEELRAVLADPMPACPKCGTPAKVLGRTGRARWLYCEAGHVWTVEPEPESTAVAS